MINLGDEVKDWITGFTGLVIGKTEYITQPPRCWVQPKAMDGTRPADGEWFDEGRLDLVTKGRGVGFQVRK